MKTTDWLSRLSPNDQERAAKWLAEPGGDAALHRIATAYKGKARRGNPGKDLRVFILRALINYMTDLDIPDLNASASAVHKTASSMERVGLPATSEAFRRKVRETVADDEIRWWSEAEQVATSMGRRVLRNPIDEHLELTSLAHARAMRRRLDADIARVTAPAQLAYGVLVTEALASLDLPIRQARQKVHAAVDAYNRAHAGNPI